MVKYLNKYFTKEDNQIVNKHTIKMFNKHIFKCSFLLGIREMQIKSSMK